MLRRANSERGGPSRGAGAATGPLHDRASPAGVGARGQMFRSVLDQLLPAARHQRCS